MDFSLLISRNLVWRSKNWWHQCIELLFMWKVGYLNEVQNQTMQWYWLDLDRSRSQLVQHWFVSDSVLNWLWLSHGSDLVLSDQIGTWIGLVLDWKWIIFGLQKGPTGWLLGSSETRKLGGTCLAQASSGGWKAKVWQWRRQRRRCRWGQIWSEAMWVMPRWQLFQWYTWSDIRVRRLLTLRSEFLLFFLDFFFFFSVFSPLVFCISFFTPIFYPFLQTKHLKIKRRWKRRRRWDHGRWNVRLWYHLWHMTEADLGFMVEIWWYGKHTNLGFYWNDKR